MIPHDLARAAKARGATVVERGAYHFQIQGSLLVNYYPNSKRRSAYVAGTTKARWPVTAEQAVAMAFDAPPIASAADKDTRGKNSRRKRAALLRKDPLCHWCKTPLTIDTSTLEHIIPLDRGGLDNANNRALACGECNHGRGNNMPELAK